MIRKVGGTMSDCLITEFQDRAEKLSDEIEHMMDTFNYFWIANEEQDDVQKQYWALFEKSVKEIIRDNSLDSLSLGSISSMLGIVYDEEILQNFHTTSRIVVAECDSDFGYRLICNRLCDVCYINTFTSAVLHYITLRVSVEQIKLYKQDVGICKLEGVR